MQPVTTRSSTKGSLLRLYCKKACHTDTQSFDFGITPDDAQGASAEWLKLSFPDYALEPHDFVTPKPKSKNGTALEALVNWAIPSKADDYRIVPVCYNANRFLIPFLQKALAQSEVAGFSDFKNYFLRWFSMTPIDLSTLHVLDEVSSGRMFRGFNVKDAIYYYSAGDSSSMRHILFAYEELYNILTYQRVKPKDSCTEDKLSHDRREVDVQRKVDEAFLAAMAESKNKNS
jgi:hypothetical protein